MIGQSFLAFVRLVILSLRRQALPLATCAALVLVAPSAHADITAPQPAAKHDVGSSSGTFSNAMPIKVPPFHGLEPQLGLAYSSASSDGFVGIGWALAGLSVIERASPGGGAPKYDDTSDIFYLDGQELIKNCTTFGGTHCPQHQTYQRIKYDAAANSGQGQWTVWAQNGAKSIYDPIYTILSAPGTFRWGVKRQEDVHGNIVHYEYKCASTGVPGCHPDRITYNNGSAVITFYSATRPDADTATNSSGLNFAAGGRGTGSNNSDIIVTTQRLISVVVEVGGVIARGYKLTYKNMPVTKQSLLETIQECGSDLTVAAGTLTCPTALPAMTLEYAPVTASVAGSWTGFSAGFSPTICDPEDEISDTGYCINPVANLCLPGDYNGDGRGDIACLWSEAGLWKWYYATNSGGWALGGEWTGMVPELPVSSQCISGDLDADGRTDISCQSASVSGQWATYLVLDTSVPDPSGGGGTVTTTNLVYVGDWTGPAPGIPLSKQCVTGDFNSDGKTDFTCYTGANGSWHTALSTGSGFSGAFWTGPAPTIPLIGGSDVARQCFAGDFNGDGKTDVTCKTATSDYSWHTALSTGSNFTNSTWTGPMAGPYATDACFPGDFNADGKTDITCYTYNNSYDWYTSLSSGSDFQGAGNWTGPQLTTSAVGEKCLTGDFNGDGKTDIACNTTNGNWDTYLSLGNNFSAKQTWAGAMTASHSTQCLGGDFNGDGRSDMACQSAHGTPWSMSLSAGTQPNLLTRLTNGMGGTLDVSYLPSSRRGRFQMPVGLISQTVASLTANDGRGNSETTTYGYGTAQWSAVLKRPYGYDSHTVTQSDGSYSITYHLQTPALPGVPYLTESYSSTGSLLATAKQYFTTNTTAPYTALLTKEEATENNGNTASGTFRTTRREHDFTGNSYGAPTKIINWGDTAVTGDETTVLITYAPVNTTKYIVNLPADQTTYAGTTSQTNSTRLARIYNYYDNGAYNAIPTKGNLTGVWQWTSGFYETNNETGIWLSKGYDNYGNVTSVTDELGRITTTTMDSTSNYPQVYPFKTCNALNHCSETTWDVVLGVPLEMKDANNAVVKTAYDKLGRKISTTDPDNNVTASWSFLNWGDATQQRIREVRADGSTTDAFGIAGLWSQVYFDGFGREWKSTKKGVTETMSVNGTPTSVQTYYTKLTEYKDGRTWKQSNWFKQNSLNVFEESPIYIVMEYDGLGRKTKTIHADSSYATATYANDAGKPYAKTVAEEGQEAKAWTDAQGNITKTEEKDGSTTYTTTFEYDLLGRKTKTKDTANNETRATYDALGRRLTETRAGGKEWRYTYYDDGKLKTEEDAKGQITTLTYDTIGRLKTKVVSSDTTTWYYDEAGYGPSKGRLTRVEFPGGRKETSYDTRGLISQYKVTIGTLTPRTTTTGYDSLGRQRTITYPDGEVVTYAYDAAGLLYSLTGNKNGVNTNYVTEMRWDANGQLVKMAYGNGTTNNYTYDIHRGWLKTANAKLNNTALYTASYEYDKSARVTKSSQSTNPSNASDSLVAFVSATTQTQAGTYNLTVDVLATSTRITGSSNASLTIGASNTLGLQIGTASATVTLTTQTYASLTALASELQTKINTHPTFVAAGMSANVTHASGKLTIASAVAGPVALSITSVGGARTTLGFSSYSSVTGVNVAGKFNGISGTGAGTKLTGNAGNGAQGLAVNIAGGATGARGTVSYQPDVVNQYVYDSMDRLKQIKNAGGTVIQSYTYDGIGNITNNSAIGNYTYGDANHKHAVTAAGTNSYTYDANGSMITAPNTTFTWDKENRLASITKSGVTSSFAYDESEQRVKKTTGTTTTYYFSSLVERDAAGIDEQFYYAGSILVAKKKIEPSADYKRWYHADRLGSVRLMTGHNGEELKEYDYAAFGVTTSTYGTISNERGYTGHITDASTGLIYMGARYYDATLGRFISADSIIPDELYSQALNRYSYVYNNPMNNTDPTGHFAALALRLLAQGIGRLFFGGPKVNLRGFMSLQGVVGGVVSAFTAYADGERDPWQLGTQWVLGFAIGVGSAAVPSAYVAVVRGRNAAQAALGQVGRLSTAKAAKTVGINIASSTSAPAIAKFAEMAIKRDGEVTWSDVAKASLGGFLGAASGAAVATTIKTGVATAAGESFKFVPGVLIGLTPSQAAAVLATSGGVRLKFLTPRNRDEAKLEALINGENGLKDINNDIRAHCRSGDSQTPTCRDLYRTRRMKWEEINDIQEILNPDGIAIGRKWISSNSGNGGTISSGGNSGWISTYPGGGLGGPLR